GVAGLIFAYVGVQVLLNMMPQTGWVTLSLNVNPDLRMLGFTFVVAFVTGVVFGLAPALQSTRPAVLPALKNEKGSTLSRSKFRLRKALVVAQVALSLLLLIGAGLFVRSLRNLKTLNAGFRPDNTLVVDIDPSRNGYAGQRLRDFYERLRARIEAAPGVKAVSLAYITPLGGSRSNMFVSIDGYEYKQGERRVVDINRIGSRFFETMGIPIRLGRDFRDGDNPSFTPEPITGPPPADGALPPQDLIGPHVAIVNEALVKKYLQGRNPVGARLSLAEKYRSEGSFEIVGVVSDARYFGLRADTEPMVYTPVWRHAPRAQSLCVRTTNDPERFTEIVRREASAIDSAIPLLRVRTMEQQIDNNILQEKLVATLASFFGIVALLLASIGLYGMMAYAVTHRTREIGIRMALGARHSTVRWLVLRDALTMVIVGAAIGLPASMAVTRYASSLLYGITARDPLSAGVATMTLLTVALIASYIPARRASRVEPTIALRSE
ncbi:MAG TPA: FtsX-like permease family protein, partial [Bryobacteraceae bacterium]|nr:FtsX-like permease family protein [Bryobacteraceae bacterium]